MTLDPLRMRGRKGSDEGTYIQRLWCYRPNRPDRECIHREITTMSEERIVEQLPALMTAGEVAALLRVRVQTVYRWSSQGKLATCRIGRICRFTRYAVAAMVSENGELDD